MEIYQPFIVSYINDPWLNGISDFFTVHANAFDQLVSFTSHNNDQRDTNDLCIIKGESGIGKSHIISRFIKHCISSSLASHCVATIPAIEYYRYPISFLLKEIVKNLCRPLSYDSYNTQLARVMTHVIQDIEPDIEVTYPMDDAFIKHCKRLNRSLFKRFHKKVNKRSQSTTNSDLDMASACAYSLFMKAQDIFKPDCSILLDKALNVLFQYGIPQKQVIATEWLMGNLLDKNDCYVLGVDDRSNYQVAAVENEAKHILFTLNYLFKRYNIPLVLFFDHLSYLEDDDSLRAFGKIIDFVTKSLTFMKPVMCLRPNQWEDWLWPKLFSLSLSHLKLKTIELKPYPSKTMIEMIDHQFSHSSQKQGAPNIDLQTWRSIFQDQRLTPRDALLLADSYFQTISSDPVHSNDPYTMLSYLFKRHQKQIYEHFHLNPPDRMRLRNALLHYILHQPELKIISTINELPYDTEYFDLMVKRDYPDNEAVPIIFIINNDTQHKSVELSIQRGITFLVNHSPIKVVYIQDARCKILPDQDYWKDIERIRKRFEWLGGLFLSLNRDTVSKWYSLSVLANSIQESHIWIIDTHEQRRSITELEFDQFLFELIPQNNGIFNHIEDALSYPPENKIIQSVHT